MPTLFVATSKGLSTWAADVGLTKHVYKVAVAEGSAEDAVAALNADAFAGEVDWHLVKKQSVDAADESAVIARLSAREKMVDPTYYPKIRGGDGIFKVRIANVASHLLVKRTLAGEEEEVGKVKTVDIAQYLLRNALP